jgi:hypothetical protein
VLLRHTVCLADNHSTILASALFLLFEPARSFISHARPATLFITAQHTPRHANQQTIPTPLTAPTTRLVT